MANINLPLDPMLLSDIDSARGLQPRTAWIRDAINQKLATPSFLDSPMVPHGTPLKATVTGPEGNPVLPLRGGVTEPASKPPVNPVSPPTREYLDSKAKLRQKEQSECVHKYRDRNNVCVACGHKRVTS